jgi:DHA1 family tetracycline resistance protein-like MFS transporter
VGFGIDMGALAAAPVLGFGVWPLYATRAIGGACSGFYTAGYAYIADVSRPEDRSKNFGALGTPCFIFLPSCSFSCQGRH